VPDAERCGKASREGTSRVFEARGGDKTGLLYLARILGLPRSLHRSPIDTERTSRTPPPIVTRTSYDTEFINSVDTTFWNSSVLGCGLIYTWKASISDCFLTFCPGLSPTLGKSNLILGFHGAGSEG